MVLGASWSCIAPSPTRHNDHFEAILERNCVRPPNIVRKMARFNKLHCKVVFRSVSPCFLTKTIGVVGLLPICGVGSGRSQVAVPACYCGPVSRTEPASVRCASDRVSGFPGGVRQTNKSVTTASMFSQQEFAR